MVVFPCALLVLVALCINFIGDGLRDATDPKLARGLTMTEPVLVAA